MPKGKKAPEQKIYYLGDKIQCIDYIKIGDQSSDIEYDSYLGIDPGWKQLGFSYVRLKKGTIINTIDDLLDNCVFMLCGNAIISSYKEHEDTLIKSLNKFAITCHEQFGRIDVFVIESQTAFLANKWLEGAIYGVFINHCNYGYTVTIRKNKTIETLSTKSKKFEYHKDRKVRKLHCRNRIVSKIKRNKTVKSRNSVIDVNARRYDCTDAFLLIFMPVKKVIKE